METKATEEMEVVLEPPPTIIPKYVNNKPTSQKQLRHLQLARERKKLLQEKKITIENEVKEGVEEIKTSVIEIQEAVKDLKRKQEEDMEIMETETTIQDQRLDGEPPVRIQPFDGGNGNQRLEEPASKKIKTSSAPHPKEGYIPLSRRGFVALGMGVVFAGVSALYYGHGKSSEKSRREEYENFIPF